MTNPNEKPFDFSEPYRTRDGREAFAARSPELLSCGDRFVGWVKNSDGSTSLCSWREDGQLFDLPHGGDLVNVPEKHVRWVNIYPHGFSGTHTSRCKADAEARGGRIACIRVEFEEGEGL